MKRNLYVYYRAQVAHAPQLQQRVEEMQAVLHVQHGVHASLLRRPEAKDERHTWMEVYEDVPARFEQVLDNAFSSSGLIELIDGARHTEVFVGATACA